MSEKLNNKIIYVNEKEYYIYFKILYIKNLLFKSFLRKHKM